jgi:hypothetical protein
VKAGEVWSCGLLGDPSPWYYLVVESDSDGVDLVLLDSDGEPECLPGDRVELSWDDVRREGTTDGLDWKLVSG